MSNAKDKMRQMIAGQVDRTLIETLLVTEQTMDGMVRGSDEWRTHYIVRLAVIEELESRYDVEASMEAWAADAGDDVTYVEALVAALPVEVPA